MTDPIGLDEIRILAKQTQDLPPEIWRTTQWSGDILRARDGFMQLVLSHSSELFEEFKDHPFWLNWASKSSLLENNILYFAISGSSDPLWIERLSAAGVSTPPHFIRKLCNQKLENIVPVLKICQKLGFITLADTPEIQYLFRHFVSRGSSEFVNYMWDNGLFHHRFNGASNDLAVFSSKKLFVGNRIQFLAILWKKWGVPDAQQSRELFAGIQNYALAGNSSRGSAYQYVASHWNCHHPQWSESDSQLLLRSLLKHGPTEQVKCALFEKFNSGEFSDDLWSNTVSQTIMKDEWKQSFTRMYLEYVTIPLASSIRNKRM